MQLQQSSDWDMSEFELVNSWHYCKADLIMGVPMNLCEYVGKKRIHSKTKGFRFELYDVKMNPIIIEYWFENTTGKAKASGAKAMLKIYMRKDRNEV